MVLAQAWERQTHVEGHQLLPVRVEGVVVELDELLCRMARRVSAYTATAIDICSASSVSRRTVRQAWEEEDSRSCVAHGEGIVAYSQPPRSLWK